MNLEEYVGKVVLVKIIKKEGNYFVSKIEGTDIDVYIEDTDDYYEEELINIVEKCFILEIKDEKLIGFLMTNRKFVNDLKKINNSLRNTRGFSVIKDIYLMERIKINGKIHGIYLVDIPGYYKIYLDTKEIGIYNKNTRQGNILIRQNTKENELLKQIRDIVQSRDLTEKEVSLREEQEKEKNIIEKALNLEPNEEITKIVAINFKQKIENEEKENQIRENEKIVNEYQMSPIDKETKFATEKDVNIKQEMETKDKITDFRTLGKLLEDEGKLPKIEGKNFTKIGIIESTERKNILNENKEETKVNTTRYSMVAIASDGTTVPLDIEQDKQDGVNPTKTNYQVSHEGEVNQDDVNSRFTIGDGSFSIKNGEYGQIKVYHSPRKTIGGEGIEAGKSLDRELETDNVWEMKKEERDLAQDFTDSYRSVEEGYEEAKIHEDKTGKIKKGDKLKTADVDGEKQTKSHVHYEEDER